MLVFDGLRDTETNILAAQVLREVQDLPEVQRETVYLVYVEGLTYREAAETLSVPLGTVMSRLATARAKLAELNVETKSGADRSRNEISGRHGKSGR